MKRLIARLGEWKIDALLISGLPNIRYLTGFSGENALLTISATGGTLYTDPRYTIQAREESACRVQVARGDLTAAVSGAIRKRRWKRIGFERSRLHYAEYEALRGELPLSASLKALPPVVEELRMVKTAAEIGRMRRSALVNSEALRSALPSIRVGVSERDVAAELEYRMRRHGADGPAFDTIVAAGPRAALPHARPAAHKLEPNQLLLIDMGARAEGYCSDMTRMFAMGGPDRKSRKLFRAVLAAQQAAIGAVREGVTAGQVDRVARRALDAEGFGKAFVHSTGHGLGLEIHEAPRLGRKDRTPLQAGMVITIEPGAYIENEGGARIEDTVLVTATGCEVLTPSPKELIAL